MQGSVCRIYMRAGGGGEGLVDRTRVEAESISILAPFPHPSILLLAVLGHPCGDPVYFESRGRKSRGILRHAAARHEVATEVRSC